ncbi:hypothetical protein [Luteolibacter luteus]|uniref:Aldose 1-epimerase n=1 Tax=Luteolibacter luteus TaxID=2728835 RepID=A0A858RG21_9BACT|nr:hypothetical protein [Luteolibacter luteus]QJE95712.1 hypothetical protein HHL09_07910 [Luteolibacter luteus]
MESSARFAIRERDGFMEVTLENGQVSISVMPALGGKVNSLLHLGSGREWMWKPEGFGGYFASKPATAFQEGTLAGWDECLPTIAPCLWNGRALPDHGEVWASACTLDEEALQHGVIHISLELPCSPLRFSRRLWLEGNQVILRYRLENTGDHEEAYIWAMHPLFSIEAGDRLELPADVRAQLPPGDWTETLSFGPEGGALKAFARVEGEVGVGVCNPVAGRSLSIIWNGADYPFFGLWLTRGGWHGHHHLALEPTNSRHDALDDASQDGNAGFLAAGGGSREWEIRLNLH